ncbi:MAG: ABC transporter ATP-binding protein, partial [Paracoccaceae bacterium]|nr:ABC transporter ATP-binding protein [Paracoccaceae bacterium]
SVPAHQRGIGLVMQDGALFPHLSIADNIGFGLPRTDRDRAHRIADLVRLVGLDPAITTRRPHQLSGGQQQRVALARALATRPRVILLDEPFSALDSGLRSATRRAVSALLADAGITAILVTHDQQEALSFADQLAVMSDGRFLQVGPPQDLYSRPASAIVATFLGEALILPARIADGIAHTELGAFAADDPTPRDKASIVVRPEQVIIEPAPEQGGQGALRAVVREIEFVGAATTLLLELENSAHARRAETAPFALTCVGVNRLAAGEWVRLRVDTPVHVLP